MRDRHLQDFLVDYGLYFEDTFSHGEQDIRDDGFGGDGKVVQPSAAEPRDGAPPGDEVAGLPRAGEVRGHLSLSGEASIPSGYTVGQLFWPSLV